MFPSIEESKAFFDEKKVVSQILKSGSNPMDLLIWANKYVNNDK